ncbi:hypothetical protein KL930_003650 [Ogataea haglerorum]|uniref:Uncharacterized protein n=1 Tax=Ogataea haglerorum TaxID=1937702 RepID=A0ABQ7REZ5_9ASCO|nr:hypothetical protein KL915_003043 [Ogataea haglerorum]KAG7705594.1 hypothetical protein KL914_003432 [Ogataea haglerorum]KAG7707389.1 hypothetical protein KL950_003049 [Ogataea haglerorum]KAG7718315.1 hypothetical protein KL913_002310 [Ogataea haglerorum]KAG7718836.1 hypothetical protein KL949_002832 [Ogataea haglerorum]
MERGNERKLREASRVDQEKYNYFCSPSSVAMSLSDSLTPPWSGQQRSRPLRVSRTVSESVLGTDTGSGSDWETSTEDADNAEYGPSAIPKRVFSSSSEVSSRRNSLNTGLKRPSVPELLSLESHSVPPSPNAMPAQDSHSPKLHPDDQLDLAGAPSPNLVFKKIVSKKKMVPKAKSFKRVIIDLENEFSPLDTEIQHESMVTSALKDKSRVLSSRIATALLARPFSLNQDNLKKFEIINRANELWNQRPVPRSRSNSAASTASDMTPQPAAPAPRVKRLPDEGPPTSSLKRRVVSIAHSPPSPFFPPSRKSSKLVRAAPADPGVHHA